MELVRHALAAGFVAAATALIACSGPTTPNGTPGQNAAGRTGNVGGSPGGSFGKVSAGLIVGGAGQALQSLSWTISGGPGGTYTGTDQIGDAMAIEWTAGGIVVGCGYNLSVIGLDTAGDLCSGATTTPFCVTADPTGATAGVTFVSLLITCEIPTDAAVPTIADTGSVFVDASARLVNQAPFSCPGISAFSISPAAVIGSQLAGLSVSTIGAPGTINWSATSSCADGGTINGFVGPDGGADTTDPRVQFDCGSCVGTATVTAQVENLQLLGGDAAVNVCNGVDFTTMSGTIVCEGGGSAAGGSNSDP